MNSTLNLEEFIKTALDVPAHSKKDAFMHLVEEVGEVSICLHRPEKAGEALVGELADVIICALDIYKLRHGIDMQLLNDAIDEKCKKWANVAKG